MFLFQVVIVSLQAFPFWKYWLNCCCGGCVVT